MTIIWIEKLYSSFKNDIPNYKTRSIKPNYAIKLIEINLTILSLVLIFYFQNLIDLNVFKLGMFLNWFIYAGQ